MSHASIAAAALLRGRVAAESLMVDTFAAYAPGAEVTKANGLPGVGYSLQYTTAGKATGRPRALEAKDNRTTFVMVGKTKRPVIRGGLAIPMSKALPVAGDFGFGWEFECTAVATTSDPNLVGQRFLVVGISVRTYQTARRLDVVLLNI